MSGHRPSSEEVHDHAIISLATNNQYATGALVLGQSLRTVNTRGRLVLLITDGVTQPLRNQLEKIWDSLILVASLDSEDSEHLCLLARPELGITFTKLKVWTFTQFKKCVFLDADTLVIQNVDELFEREELSAAPDIGWPDCFNSGVFVFEPSMATYHALLTHATEHGSFDGGDQGLLNTYFKSWATKDISYHLPFLYNMVSNVCYTYAPAYKQFGNDVKIVHFLGAVKPWHQHFDKKSGKVTFISSDKANQCDQKFVQLWWNIYDKIHETDKNETGIKDEPIQTTAEAAAQNQVEGPPDQEDAEQLARQSNWEQGQIDYTGVDKFSRIRSHLDNKINGNETGQKGQPIESADPVEESELEKHVQSVHQIQENAPPNQDMAEQRARQSDWEQGNKNEVMCHETGQKDQPVKSADHVKESELEKQVQSVAQSQEDAPPNQGNAEQQARQSYWDQGKIDYTGVDSFLRIQRHLDNKIYGHTLLYDKRYVIRS